LHVPILAMGKGEVAKGKDAKPAKKDMDVKDNVQKTKTKAMHATAHAMKKVKNTPVGMLVPNGEEKEQPVIFDEEPEEKAKAVVKAYYQFHYKLATALRLCKRKCPRSRHCHIAVESKVNCNKWQLHLLPSLGGTTNCSRALRNWICTSHNKRSPRHTPSKSW